MNDTKKIEALKELKEETKGINDGFSLTNWKNKATNLIIRIYGKDSIIIEQIDCINLSSALSLADRKIQASSLIDGIIKEIERFGLPVKVTKNENGLNINITQTQNQDTKVSINLFIESVQEELTGGQLKELQEIISNKEFEPKEKKQKIIDKLKKFGSDIAISILANIFTNPNIFG